MTTHNIKRKLLSSSVAAIVGSLSIGVMAQEAEAPVDEIVITGIRASLTKSMDIKRNSAGVVDAITAEDMGKMPDTNLAESLQRITGVSISRNNGEGAQVTVRGFGPDFNLITLNGRQMPASTFQATTASNSRSFDFANLAAESVAGIEVYKTGKANLTTGGIGSLLNIKSARPFELNGLHASAGVKAVADQSNRVGSDVTPEISGIFSNTFADGTIGVTLSGNYAERNSGFNAAESTSGWNSFRGLNQGANTANLTNPPDTNDIYSIPQNFMYHINDQQRKRTNGILTLQWSPIEKVTGTLDLVYSKLDIEQQRQELSTWFGAIGTTGGEYTGGISDEVRIVSPVLFVDGGGGVDIGMGVGSWGTINENKSIGINVKWETTDNLTLGMDYHNSNAEVGAKDDRGTNNIVTALSNQRKTTSVDYTYDLPVLDITYSGTDTELDPSKFSSSGTYFRNSFMKSEIQQLQLTGQYQFDDSVITSIDFGLSSTEGTNRSAFSNAQRETWGGYGTPADFDDSLFTRKILKDEFKNIPGHEANNLEPYYYAVDFKGMVAAIGKIAEAKAAVPGAQKDTAFSLPCGFSLCSDPALTTDRTAIETQNAIYAQANFAFDIGAMQSHFDIGARYEETDVEAKAEVPIYTSVNWVSVDAFEPISDGTLKTNKLTGNYSNFLPNIDFDIEVIENVKLRASSSITISRPSFADIQGGQTINRPVRINNSTGNTGNPNLKPFESKNLDVSAEWYYSEGSYVSLGYYRKDVENYIGSVTVPEPLFNLATPGSGARFNQAAIDSGAIDPNDPTIIDTQKVFNYMLNQYGVLVGGKKVIQGDAAAGDLPVIFNLVTPVNQKEASIDGFELALQHMFGESGFGGVINYTTVNGDISYDTTNLNTKTEKAQFVLPGLSDSANLAAFYDKNGLQARIAYNWRDTFLLATRQGNAQPNPAYIYAFGQIDVNISYAIIENLNISLEVINLTNENNYAFGRSEFETLYAGQTGTRYNIGASYKF
jgi:TonB-dependent receptor